MSRVWRGLACVRLQRVRDGRKTVRTAQAC